MMEPCLCVSLVVDDAMPTINDTFSVLALVGLGGISCLTDDWQTLASGEKLTVTVKYL